MSLCREPLLPQVALQPAAPGASPRGADRVTAALGRAQDAAAAHVQAGPQATGERLRANFLAVLQTVQQHDTHLLAELETGFITAYKVGSAGASTSGSADHWLAASCERCRTCG